jgi:hypothetical protein
MLTLHMNIIKGEIVITFGQLLSWVSFTPAASRELAANLTRLADEAEKADPSKPAGASIQ